MTEELKKEIKSYLDDVDNDLAKYGQSIDTETTEGVAYSLLSRVLKETL